VCVTHTHEPNPGERRASKKRRWQRGDGEDRLRRERRRKKNATEGDESRKKTKGEKVNGKRG